MALIDLKSDLSWYGKTPPNGVYRDDRNNTRFTYNDDLTVTTQAFGQLGQNVKPRTSADEFNAWDGVSKRKTQLGTGTQLPIGPTGTVHGFDTKRIGWYAGFTYGSVFNQYSDSGLAKTYTDKSPIDDMYNKFKVRDQVYDPFGYAKTPFILRGIQQDDRTDPQRWGLNSPTMDVPRDGVVSSGERIANDAARLGKFLIRPNGLLFIGKQALLHLMQPNPEDVLGMSSALDPQKVFNPVNFLASALGSPLGLRFKNWGLQPLISLSSTYESTKKAQNFALKLTPPIPVTGLGGNRLLNLHFERLGNFVNPLGEVEWITTSAVTGPDSVGGVGRTNFTKKQEYNTLKYPSGLGEIESIPIGDVLDWSNTYARQNRIVDIPVPSDVYNIGAHFIKPVYNAKQLEGEDASANFYVNLKKNQRIGFMLQPAASDKRQLSTRKMMINRVSSNKQILLTTPDELNSSLDLFPLTGIRAQFDWHNINGDTTDWYGRNIKASTTYSSLNGPESGKAKAVIYLGTREVGKNTGEYIPDDADDDGDIKSFNPGRRFSDGDKAIAEKLADTVKVDDKMKGKFFGGVKELVEKKFDRSTAPEPATIIDYRAMSYPQIRKTTKDRVSGTSKVLDFRTLQDGAAAEWDTTKKPTLESFYGYTSYNAADRKTAKPDPVQNAGFGTGTNNTSNIKDLIKFEFEGLGGPQHGKRYMFRAYINSLDDTFSPSWSGQQDQGRADQKYLYASYERQINVDFKVVVHSHKEMGTVWDKLSELAQNTLPVYPGGGFHGQFIRITIGDLYVRQYMFINSLTYSWDNETPWEITEGMQLPLYTDVSLGLTHVGANKPQSGQNPFQYDRKTKLYGPFGDEFAYTPAGGVSQPETRDNITESVPYDAAENKATVYSEEQAAEDKAAAEAGAE